MRNFGRRGVVGVRLVVEWLVKAGYGVSVLATIPLLVIPLQATLAPLVSLCMDDSAGSLTPVQENLITAGVLGGSLPYSRAPGQMFCFWVHHAGIQMCLRVPACAAGASCAMAILLPNVEFVFGLAGSTASVLIAFILPAAIFLQTTGSQRGMLGASVDMLHGSRLWRQRRRMATALLLFGVAAGFMCTHALVTSIQEEAEVVQLAQELVREEERVVKATETEMKAKQVADAVGAVSEAAKQLDSAKQKTATTQGTVAKVAGDLNGTSFFSKRKAERAGLKTVQTGEVCVRSQHWCAPPMRHMPMAMPSGRADRPEQHNCLNNGISDTTMLAV